MHSILALVMVTLAYLSIGRLQMFNGRQGWKAKKPPSVDGEVVTGLDVGNERCIIQHMERADKQCVVFFGSQTGNAQTYAEKLAKEAHTLFNLRTMVADLEEYDYHTLNNFPDDKVAIFVLATYGDGEPTDNAVGFYEHITADPSALAESMEEKPKRQIRYAAFGLGNSTYEHYNSVIRKVDASLQRLGGQRIGPLGEGDDADGTTEDSFLAWKDEMLESLCKITNLTKCEIQFEPNFTITESHCVTERIYLGERSSAELHETAHTRNNPNAPCMLKVLKSHELFNTKHRNCLHFELDITESGLSYETGDHAVLWPTNNDVEVNRFLRVFGYLDKRNTYIHTSALGSDINVPIPSPTTYDAAVRYYLDIAGPVSRQSLIIMSEFATNQAQKAELLKLGSDKNYFHRLVSTQLLNLAQLIEAISPETPTCPVPFPILLECVRAIKPRYYSISSSSLTQKNTVSITVVVDSIQFPDHAFHGVASNYLLAMKNEMLPQIPSTTLSEASPRYKQALPMQIRRSTFKLPVDNSRPIIMIGAGTGVAPFRAFMHERAAQFQAGASVGKALLFYGCRRPSEDFIYKTEWQVRINVLHFKWSIR